MWWVGERRRGAHFIGPMSPEEAGVEGLLWKKPFCVPTEMTRSAAPTALADIARSVARRTIAS